ncbi:MAG: hypothetical protein FalmKO_18450 [Falsiruegeria mediterranea]
MTHMPADPRIIAVPKIRKITVRMGQLGAKVIIKGTVSSNEGIAKGC